MEKTIHRFVLRHARRETLAVIALTLLSLPIYYLSLDIPKTIVNQAILGKGMEWPTVLFGVPLGQVGYLFALCGAFLLAVIVNGGLKQYINTLKGRLGERLLRRLRYELVSRVLRFPLPHFRKVSAAEIVPMVTSEVEPIGGYMGDAFAQPLIQFGTLATIVVFLFVQDPLMGLAAISLYPIQAYLIPKLQRRVNQLGKERVRAVRRLAERIGETVGGIQEIRAHGTGAYERAHYAALFGRIFAIRFEIYQRKAFVKFLNNFLNQLAPLLFYALGGFLVIHGDLTLGALTAALTANKDMSAPWKELLDWYQQSQDAKIKYEQVTEQFRPAGLLEATLQTLPATSPPPLAGPIAARGVGVVDESGLRQLEQVSVALAPGQRVALLGAPGGGKEAFALLLARLVQPGTGQLLWGSVDVARLDEATLGARLGYVGPQAYVFAASIRDNLLYGLRQKPVGAVARDAAAAAARRRDAAEARRAGNSDLDPEDDWIDRAGIVGAGADAAALDAELLALLAQVDLAEDVYTLGLRGRIDPERHPTRAATMLAARAALAERLQAPEHAGLVERFDPARFNTNATLAENLLFGAPLDPRFAPDALAGNAAVMAVLDQVGLVPPLLAAGRRVAATMVELFADLPPGHELFAQYSFLSADELALLPGLLARLGAAAAPDDPADRTRLLSLPLKLVDARHRLGVIDDDLKARILAARMALRDTVTAGVAPFDPDRYNAAATIQDNILFGKVTYGTPRAEARVARLVAETLEARGLRAAVREVGLDFAAGVAGSRLTQAQRQKLALARALAKRPALLVVNEATQGLDPAAQARVMAGVLAASRDALVVWVIAQDDPPPGFDRALVFAEGRLMRDSAH